MANDTILCKIALGTLNDFTESESAQNTIPYVTIYERIDKESKIVDKTVWVPELYRIFLRRYKNWEICYTNVSDFLDAFWERAEIHFPNYYYRKSVYARILSMSDDELLDIGSGSQKSHVEGSGNDKNITNIVEHTDDIVKNPLDTVLENITNQNSSKGSSDNTVDTSNDFSNFADKSERIRAQIYNANLTLLEDFLRKFKSLFIITTSRSDYYG